MTDTTLGQRIAERRKLLGLSQEALGEMLEVSRQAVSKWESDVSMPETDKIVDLSQVFGVSVGWLLGVEALPQSGNSEKTDTAGYLTEEQLKQMVSECCQEQPDVKRKSRSARIAACCAAVSVLASVIFYTQTQAKLKTYTDDLDSLSKNYATLQSQLTALKQELSDLNELSRQDRLLGSYSLTAKAAEDAAAGIITFEGFPNQTQPTDQVWLTVRLEGQEVASEMCRRDGAAYTATVELPAADGYSYQYLVVHQGGNSSVQQLDEADDLAVNLAWGLEMQIGADFVWEARGSKLEIEACRLELKPPLLALKGESAAWKQVELVFYQNGVQLRSVSLQKYVEYLTGAGEMVNWISGTVYPEVGELALSAGDTLEARILAVLDNGTETEKTVYIWTCDSTGHVTEKIPVG